MKHSKQTILRGYSKNEGKVAPQKGARSQIIRDEDLKRGVVNWIDRVNEVAMQEMLSLTKNVHSGAGRNTQTRTADIHHVIEIDLNFI